MSMITETAAEVRDRLAAENAALRQYIAELRATLVVLYACVPDNEGGRLGNACAATRKMLAKPQP